MTHTFWHSGILIGQADLEPHPGEPRCLGGVFLPTSDGEAIAPRLVGMLSAAEALKDYCERRGLDPDRSDAEMAKVFERTPIGRKMVAIGRAIREVEVRGPTGERVDFATMSFADRPELRKLTGLPCEDAPRYLVSLTVKSGVGHAMH